MTDEDILTPEDPIEEAPLTDIPEDPDEADEEGEGEDVKNNDVPEDAF